MRIVKYLGLLLLTSLLLAALYSMWRSRPLYSDTLAGDPWSHARLAPAELAFTLARSNDGHVLLVTAITAQGINGVNLSALKPGLTDAVAAWQHFGADGLDALWEQANFASAFTALDLPVDVDAPHIAAGTNYQAHAEEVGHDDDPFLFPKLSDATPWNAYVERGARLDFEVELCMITLSAHTRAQVARLGLLLCQDFTDRWVLVRDIDTSSAMGISGFPSGKGGPTRLPVGAFLVIPRDAELYREIELRAYVNRGLRQSARADKMIWPPSEIVANAMQGCQRQYRNGDRPVRLDVCEQVDERTLLLTGTPEGVIFNLPNLWNPFVYLGPGDEVISSATFLGVLQNRIR
ncbi:MAG: fumarylacetoacetate hydrolase family protein [Pseudomonadota bacterium]